MISHTSVKASRHHCKGRALLARHSQVHDSAFYYEPPKASLQKQAVPTVRASSHLSAAARLACTPRVRAQQMLARHETIARVKRPRWTDEEIDALHHIVTLYMTPEGVGWKELTPQVVASLWPPASTPRKISQLASKWHAIGNARMTHEPQHGAMPLDRPPLEISLPLDPLGERHMEGHEATLAFNDDTYTVKFVKKGMEGGLQRYLLTLEGPGESEGDGGGDEGGDGDGGGGGDGGSDGGGEGGGEGGGDGGGEGGGNGGGEGSGDSGGEGGLMYLMGGVHGVHEVHARYMDQSGSVPRVSKQIMHSSRLSYWRTIGVSTLTAVPGIKHGLRKRKSGAIY